MRFYFKKKNIEEYNKGLNEYENFLKDFYEYDYYYNFDVTKIDYDDYNQLTVSERKDIELIKGNISHKLLLDEFKYKKCDGIYMNMKFNQKIWDKCYDTILEQQKLIKDPNENKGTAVFAFNKSNSFVRLLNFLLKFWGLEINENNYKFYIYFMILSFLIISIILMLFFY